MGDLLHNWLLDCVNSLRLLDIHTINIKMKGPLTVLLVLLVASCQMKKRSKFLLVETKDKGYGDYGYKSPSPSTYNQNKKYGYKTTTATPAPYAPKKKYGYKPTTATPAPYAPKKKYGYNPTTATPAPYATKKKYGYKPTPAPYVPKKEIWILSNTCIIC